jgi:GNAT superfamily N-acetyltransferase
MQRKPLMRISDLTSASEIPSDFLDRDCGSCLYWLDNNSRMNPNPEEHEMIKKEWVSSVANMSGSSGKIVYLDKEPVGWAHYGPVHCFPRAFTYTTQPGDDSYFIACLVIAPGFRRHGVAEALLDRVIEDVRFRGVGAIETFARKGSVENPSGPIELYLKAGFKVKAKDPMFPLLRYEFPENKKDHGMSQLISQTRYGLDQRAMEADR